jgi:hypothetical protein
MPCNHFRYTMPNGETVIGFACTRGSIRHDHRALPCVVCGKPHAVLCDGNPGAWPNIITRSGTCSAPLCREHAYHVAPDKDYCPRCKPTQRNP